MSEIINATDVIRVSTGIVNSEAKDDFLVTPKAVEIVNQIKAQNNVPQDYFLRIGTRSGGCSGMSYSLGFDNEVKTTDRILESDNIKFVIDAKSLFYIMGVTLDYTEGPYGSGFTFNNPNNEHTCGCSH